MNSSSAPVKKKLQTYRLSLDRIDSAFIFLLEESLLDFLAETNSEKFLEWKPDANVHPAIATLIETLLEKIPSLFSKEAENQPKLSSFELEKAQNLFQLLGELLFFRFKIITQIGVVKALEKLPIRDLERWQSLLKHRLTLAEKQNIPSKPFLEWMDILHESSCTWQEIIQKLIHEGKDFQSFQK